MKRLAARYVHFECSWSRHASALLKLCINARITTTITAYFYLIAVHFFIEWFWAFAFVFKLSAVVRLPRSPFNVNPFCECVRLYVCALVLALVEFIGSFH